MCVMTTEEHVELAKSLIAAAQAPLLKRIERLERQVADLQDSVDDMMAPGSNEFDRELHDAATYDAECQRSDALASDLATPIGEDLPF